MGDDGFPVWNQIIEEVPFFWWRTVYLSTEPIESISGFLPTFNYDPVSGYRTSAIRVDDLRPGDPDPRAPEFVVDRIHMILDSESRNACGYLFFRRADGAPMETHPGSFLRGWPRVLDDTESVFEISRDSTGMWLPADPDNQEVVVQSAEEEILPDGWISPWFRHA